ncbi:MAG: hypothetical protein ACNYVW_02505 [Methanosarcinales archaeon]
MRQNKFPPGWDEKRVHRVLAHYESQTEDEAVAEDEAAYEQEGQTIMEIPQELVSKVRDLIAQHTQQQVDK